MNIILPLNTPGRFHVNDQCIDCDLCREAAPGNFTRADNDPEPGYSYVYKQPKSQHEIAQCYEALCSCPVKAIVDTSPELGEGKLTEAPTVEIKDLLLPANSNQASRKKIKKIANDPVVIRLASMCLSAIEANESERGFLMDRGSVIESDIPKGQSKLAEKIKSRLSPLVQGHDCTASASIDDITVLFTAFGDLLDAGLVNGFPNRSIVTHSLDTVSYVGSLTLGFEPISDEAKRAARAAKALIKQHKKTARPRKKSAKASRSKKKS